MKYFTEQDLVSQEALFQALNTQLAPFVTEHNTEAEFIITSYKEETDPARVAFDEATKKPMAECMAIQEPLFNEAKKISDTYQRQVEEFVRKMKKKTQRVWATFEKEQAKIKQKFALATTAEQAVYDAATKEAELKKEAALDQLDELTQSKCDPVSTEYKELLKEMQAEKTEVAASEAVH